MFGTIHAVRAYTSFKRGDRHLSNNTIAVIMNTWSAFAMCDFGKGRHDK